MDTIITKTDEFEAKVEIKGYIFISLENKDEFEKEVGEVINKYAI